VLCIKCGSKLKEGQVWCVHCGYVNNLTIGFIYENTIMSEIGDKKITDYKKLIKKTAVDIMSIIMIGVALGGGIFLLFGDEGVKASMGLASYSSDKVYKEKVTGPLRGAKLGMSREDIIRLENDYIDSVRELNNENYVTYTGSIYGDYKGRTTYEFTGNSLKEISVIFYPKDDIVTMFDNLNNTFNNEFGQSLGNTEDEVSSEESSEEEGEAVEATAEEVNEVQWKKKDMIIKLQKDDYVKLTVNYAK